VTFFIFLTFSLRISFSLGSPTYSLAPLDGIPLPPKPDTSDGKFFRFHPSYQFSFLVLFSFHQSNLFPFLDAPRLNTVPTAGRPPFPSGPDLPLNLFSSGFTLFAQSYSLSFHLEVNFLVHQGCGPPPPIPLFFFGTVHNEFSPIRITPPEGSPCNLPLKCLYATIGRWLSGKREILTATFLLVP